MPPARNPQRPARVASAGAARVPAGRQIRRPAARPGPAAPGRAQLRAHSPDPEYLPAGAASRQRVSWVVTAARSGMDRPRAAAGAPTAAADAPAARPTAAERNRQVQREYLERKQARTEAVYAQVSELEARRAELQAQLGPLLARHEQLTRSLPWHEQTEEWSFMASIASCAPGGADEEDTPDQAPLPDLIQSMMLEPDATVEHLYASADLHDTAEEESAVFKPLCLMPGPKPSCSTPWRRLVAKLQLTRAQREGIAAGYEHHIQSEAFLHEDCLGIAAKLQKLPRLVGDLTDSLKPNLAMCAIGCQLAAIAQRGKGLTQQLTRTCFQVFSGAQMKILCELVSVLPLDVRGLCREIAATGPAKRRVQSAPITRLISPAAHSRKRAAARRTVTEQDTITADVASDDARGNAPNVVPQKRRSAGPSSPQDIDKVKKRRER
ncbi:hypothetical protein WJX75_007300 [Coccomyxa subellipsoidea]|uniref:BZIP domain-containing protein n=1 Tax=Coccomyxa subellipsoidea TaxID=248742 RepID=A0ABR2YD54_9CHLO